MKYFFCAILALSICGCVQQEATREEMNHEYIIDYPGVQKNVIFTRSLKWIANNFKSSKAVIEYQDTASGSIIGNGAAPTSFFAGPDMLFTMNIDVRDGRARYRFINIQVTAVGGPGSIGNLQMWHVEAKRIFDDIVARLKIATNTSDDF